MQYVRPYSKDGTNSSEVLIMENQMNMCNVCIQKDTIKQQTQTIKEQQKEIDILKIDVAVAKSDISTVKGDIREVKDDIKDIKTSVEKVETKVTESVNRLVYWILGLGGSIVITAVGIIVTLLSRK